RSFEKASLRFLRQEGDPRLISPLLTSQAEEGIASSDVRPETKRARRARSTGWGPLRALQCARLFERASANASYWSVAMKSTPASIAACHRKRTCSDDPKL